MFNVNSNINHFEKVSDEKIKNFWKDVLRAWIDDNCSVFIRNFFNILEIYKAPLKYKNFTPYDLQIDKHISMLKNGDLFLQGPQIASSRSTLRSKFYAGNIDSIHKLETTKNLNFFTEMKNTRYICKERCNYFKYCGGGYIQSKFENFNSLNASKTELCKAEKIILVQAIEEVFDMQTV